MTQPESKDDDFPSKVIKLSVGRGLAASKDVEAGVVIQKFGGPIVHSYAEVPAEEKTYALWYGYPDTWLIPKTNSRYINHSCDPNCTVNEKKEIVTTRPVKDGEQFSFAYNVTYEDGFWDPLWSFDCFCGTSKCMGRVECYVDVSYKPFSKA